MKLQWSIQPRHAQLALDNVTHLNYRNMHIWPPTKLDYITCEAFHLAPYTSYHLIFLNQNISLWDRCLKFLIFHLMSKSLAFGHHTFYFRLFSLFLSQILVCETDFCSSISLYFCSSISLFIWRFTFGELFKQKQ